MQRSNRSDQERGRAGQHGLPPSGMLGVCVVLTLSLALSAGRVEAEIFLNELRTQSNPQVEFYNSGPSVVDLGGWKIEADNGTFTIPGPTLINSGQHLVVAGLGGIFDPLGGIVSVLDDIDTLTDRVRYGIQGGAPAPPPPSVFNISLSRSPDASSSPAPPLIPNLDGLFWTLDQTATFGAANDVPNPDLGRDICINEMLNDPTATLADSVEFCNPPLFTAGDTDLDDWFITTAFGVQVLSGTVPAGGFLAIELDTDLNLTETFRVDLFTKDGVRVYQKSIFGAPEPRNICHGDCPDGAAPPDGWDFITCGGFDTFFPLPCTMGESNVLVMGDDVCRPADVPDWTPDVQPRSWGEIKLNYGGYE